MADDRLPEQYRARTSQRLPARAGGSAPLHPAAHLEFGGSAATREELWERLHPAVREKATDRAGQLLQWWASEEDGRVSAVALGTQALVVLTPILNAKGGRATEIGTVPLNESSFRSARIAGPADPVAAAPSPSPSRRLPVVRDASLVSQLNEGMSGFLGQLPARAQQLLQDPFQHTARQLSYDYFYYRVGHPTGIGGATLSVWCYFTDMRVVTFCAGAGRGYRESGGFKSWELTCWRADVKR